jgi:hypothetical protein
MKQVFKTPFPVSLSDIPKFIRLVEIQYNLSRSELFVISSYTHFIICYDPSMNSAKRHVLEMLKADTKLFPRSYLAIDFVTPQESLRRVGLALSSLTRHNVITCEKVILQGCRVWTIKAINPPEKWVIV